MNAYHEASSDVRASKCYALRHLKFISKRGAQNIHDYYLWSGRPEAVKIAQLVDCGSPVVRNFSSAAESSAGAVRTLAAKSKS